MIGDYLTSGAYRVVKGPVYLFDGTLTASPTIGSWPAGVTGRCKVTLSSVTGHTDCAGTITIGSETITFIQAGTKNTTVNLTAKPTVSSSGLDCHCTIKVIDAAGQEILAETLTAINTRIETHQSYVMQPSGAWTTIQDTAILSDTSLSVGDIVRKGSTDYIIKKADDNPDLGGISDFYSYLA